MNKYFFLLFCFSMSSILAKPTKDKYVVSFVYHRFGDSRYPSTNVSLVDFEAHLQFLKTQKFQVLTLSQAADYLQNDAPAQKTAVITIDDGYKSFYKNGLPLLEKYGFVATVFVNTETIGGSDYMNWAAIKDASARGIEIGNHTHSHAYFLNQPAMERYINFEQELILSQNLIAEHLGKKPTAFAYPYGEFDPKMKEIVKSVGFKVAAAQYSGVIHGASDLLKCPRFPMSEAYSESKKFAAKAEMLPLKLTQENPVSFVLPEGVHKPELTITFEKNDLLIDQLQCFIQGSDCIKSIDESGNLVTIKLQSRTSISTRRRTLYTVTVPDKNGHWHWFSHLWVRPEAP